MKDEIKQSVIERLSYLDCISRSVNSRTSSISKIASTLKLLDSSKCLSYSTEEFEKEFGLKNNNKQYFKQILMKNGIKKPRLVVDNGTVYVWQVKV